MRSVFILLFLSHWAWAQKADFQIEVYAQEKETEVQLLANNPHPFPISVKVNVELKGTQLKSPLEDYYVLEPLADEYLLSSILKPVNKAWSYRYGYTYSMGDAKAVHNDDFAYQLPFPAGKSYRLTQGYNGRSTHQGINALDFTMPEGDVILAARAGKVVRVKESSNRGCPAPRCVDDANYISILHEDGTLADYVHLQKNGALVEVGDEVEKGQKIALNGDTGWASGAHLHFVVYTTGEQPQITIPVKFEVAPGKVEALQEGRNYEAF